MAENQGPWWTRPPSPSRPSATPGDGETGGEAPATPPMPMPSSGPDADADADQPDVLDLRDRPRRSRRSGSANRQPPPGEPQDTAPEVPPLGANPFGVDSYSTDPFSAGHVDADHPLGADGFTGPGRTDSGAPTEQLPPVPPGSRDQGYDALGVYGTPTAVAPGIPGLTTDADPVDHLRDPAEPRLRVPNLANVPWRELPGRIPWRQVQWQRIPWKPISAAAVVLFIVVTLVRLVTGGGDDPATQASQNASGQEAAAEAAGEPKNLDRVDAADAEKDLRDVGQSRGDVQDAWGWTDDNGRNLLATTRERVGGNVTLRVVHAAELDGDGRALRVMTDPSLPGCKGEGTAGFAKGSVKVQDVNRDGVAEATVGWLSRCGAKGEKSRVKLALLSDGQKYIIRGEGVIGESGTRVPDPDTDQWPKGYLKAATAVFEKVYF